MELKDSLLFGLGLKWTKSKWFIQLSTYLIYCEVVEGCISIKGFLPQLGGSIFECIGVMLMLMNHFGPHLKNKFEILNKGNKLVAEENLIFG